MRERNRRPATVADRDTRKMPARRRQLRLTQVTLDHTESGILMVKDTPATRCPRHHGCGPIRQIRLDRERRLAVERFAGWLKTPTLKGTGECPIYRHLHGYVPVGRAADTRTLTTVVCMDAQRINRLHQTRIS
jgi:hypothetical protein